MSQGVGVTSNDYKENASIFKCRLMGMVIAHVELLKFTGEQPRA